jgi:DGQHR domain-containing protein
VVRSQSVVAVTRDHSAVGLKVQQSALDIEFYVFAVDGKFLAGQLGVRRMRWHQKQFKTEGFQRTLDNVRVQEIAQYLSDNPPILPNSIVVAFEPGTVDFQALPNQDDPKVQWGTLTIHARYEEHEDGTLKSVPEAERIGYVIDGQHRLRGIEQSTRKPGEFPVIIAAFHKVDTRFQLQQFYALNQTVPINPSQIALLRTELGLKQTGRKAHEQQISAVREIIARKPNSPFEPGKYMGSTVYPGPLDVTVIERMIDRAAKITTLQQHWRQDANEIPVQELEYVAQALYVYWQAVRETWPQFWGKKPREQRLFAAIGLQAMIQLYDRAMEGIDVNSAAAVKQVQERLKAVSDIPWDKMSLLSSSAKTAHLNHLVDAVKDLWDKKGQRPAQFLVAIPTDNPNERVKVVDLELT